MVTTQLQQPFGDEPLEDVHLARAPLARVLAQLRFEPVSALQSTTVFERFSSGLSSSYPYADHASEAAIFLAGQQLIQQPTTAPVLRLKSPDKADVVALTNGSLSFETTNYAGRAGFCEGLTKAARVLYDVAKVPAYSRIGVRYTNRISDPSFLSDLALYVRPEIVGLSGVELQGRADRLHTLAQAAFQINANTGMLIQWGEMPPNGTFDPGLSSVPDRSWVLDIDAYMQADQLSNDPDEVSRSVTSLSMHAYRFFRWAVNPKFIDTFRE